MNFPIKHSLIITTTVFTIGLGGMAAPVFAQEDSADEQDLDSVLEEVIVTAQRKAENVQDVPISMTVFSEEQIANANMTNASDLTTLTPSLTVDTRFGYENTAFAIRGFTQSLRTTASVATYFADVVAPRGQTSQTSGDGAGPGYLFDLQNIQVLKGPQGTLFGRNTTGGAILLTPQEPTDVFEGYVEGSAGNFDAKRVQTVINLPVADTFRVRLGVDSNERDGHLNNVTGIGEDELGSSDYTATRLSLSWNITDSLENSTILQYVDSKSSGYSATLFDCNQTLLSGISGIYAQCLAQLERERNNGQDGAYDVASGILTAESTIKEKRVINTTTFEVNDDLAIKNIFGYSHLETTNGSSVFGTDWPTQNTDPAAAGYNANPAFVGYQLTPGSSLQNPDVPVTSQESYIEEVQIQGTSLDEHLDWQVGAYYEHSRPDGYSGNNSAGFLSCDMASIEGDPSGFKCYDPLAGQVGSVLVQNFKTDFLNKAVYGQATYDFTDEFSVTAGLRYTKDQAEGYGIKDRYTFTADGTRRLVVSADGIQRDHFHTTSQPKVESEEPTGMIDFTFRPAEDVMTYFKYTRGYRQGSVNLAADPGVDTHNPEYIDTYEIGAKTSFGGPIPGQFNIAAFDNELEDMQLQFGYISPTSGPTTAITNAGKAVVKGIEMDTVLKLNDDLTLSLSYSHLSTELKEQGALDPETIRQAVLASTNGDVAAAAIAASNVSAIADVGDELPFAPKNTWVATLNYLIPVPSDMGLMSVGATWSYIGSQRAAGTSSTPYDVLPSFELMNLNASWLGIYDSNFDMSLYATNVLDKEYVTYTAGTYETIGIEVRQNGLPKMYGMRVRYNFGG